MVISRMRGGEEATILGSRVVAATLVVRGWHFRALLELRRFNPNQPRVPRGYRFGGRWIEEGDDLGPIAGGAGNAVLIGSHEDDDLPRLPEKRPESGRERHRIARDLGRYLRDANVTVRLAILLARYAWLAERTARDIISYYDPPKTLEELRDAVDDPQPGYEIHHIAERTPARRDGLPDAQIESRENKVRIPKFKHWDITGWYGKRNANYGNLSPRDYLREKSWEERIRVGMDALKVHGVLIDE